MPEVPWIALLLLPQLSAVAIRAQEAPINDEWTWWTLASVSGKTENVTGWQLAFHTNGRVSTSWVGPIYDWEAGEEFATLEGLEGIGSYETIENAIVFTNDDVSGGWLWNWRRVECELTETATDLALRNCVGTGRPEWTSEDPAKPPDMTFTRLP